MKRSSFLKSLFAVAVAAAIKDTSILKLNKASAPVIDLPGIGGKCFTIKLGKNWFRHGDLINSSINGQWFFEHVKGGSPRMYKVTKSDNPDDIKYMDVVFYEDENQENEHKQVAEQLAKHIELEHTHILEKRKINQTDSMLYFKPLPSKIEYVTQFEGSKLGLTYIGSATLL